MTNYCDTAASSTLSAAELRYSQMQRYNVRPVAGTIVEPITLEDAWRHLNLIPWGSPEATEHDDWLELIGIPAARSWCEAYLGQTIAQQSVELTSDSFPTVDYIDLPLGPVLEIEEVTYLDGAGDVQTMYAQEYALDTYSEPHRLYLAYGYEWPEEVREVRNSVKVRYVAGYTLEGDSPNDFPVPYRTRAAILILLGHLFSNREETTVLKLSNIPIGVRSFLDWDSDRMAIV